MYSQTKLIGVAGVSVTNAGTATAVFDCMGARRIVIDVIAATSNTPSNKPSVLKLSESATTDASNYSDITAFVGGGTGGFTIPNSDSSNVNCYKFNVDLRGRKRYIKATFSPVTTQIVAFAGNLFLNEQAPVSASNAGVLALVEG